jgi:hypothetical protein
MRFAACPAFLMLPHMNQNLTEIVRKILRLDSEGRLVASGINEKASLRHLVLYLSQKNSSDREKLLTLLRKMALHEHHLLGQPINEDKIGSETRNNFRKLLRTLRDTTKSDIDALYEAIVKGEIE